MGRKHILFVNLLLLSGGFCFTKEVARAQSLGAIRGTVTLAEKGTAVHDATVSIVRLKRSVESDENGAFEIKQVPVGTHRVLVHLDGIPDVVETVTVEAGQTTTIDFRLVFAGIKEDVTVTASGREQVAFESFQSVVSLDSVDLSQKSHPSIGEVLENEPGVAKRSFGPGSARPGDASRRCCRTASAWSCSPGWRSAILRTAARTRCSARYSRRR